MSLMLPIKLDLARKLVSRVFRTKFFRKRAQDEIALQIRELRTKRNMRQADLAKICAMKQSAVSRIEQANYSAWNFKTLLRVAEALDVRLRVVLDPMEDVVREYRDRERSTATTEGFSMTGFAQTYEAQGANNPEVGNDFIRRWPVQIASYSGENNRTKISVVPTAYNLGLDSLSRSASNQPVNLSPQ